MLLLYFTSPQLATSVGIERNG